MTKVSPTIKEIGMAAESGMLVCSAPGTVGYCLFVLVVDPLTHLLEGDALLVSPRGDHLVEGKHQLKSLGLNFVLCQTSGHIRHHCCHSKSPPPAPPAPPQESRTHQTSTAPRTGAKTGRRRGKQGRQQLLRSGYCTCGGLPRPRGAVPRTTAAAFDDRPRVDGVVQDVHMQHTSQARASLCGMRDGEQSPSLVHRRIPVRCLHESYFVRYCTCSWT